MYHGYSVSHEKFVWDVRTEPAIIDAFAKIWGTEKLLVSFDGINLTLPRPETEGERVVPQRWPHQDQDSKIRGFQCAQGIVNLVRLPNTLPFPFISYHPILYSNTNLSAFFPGTKRSQRWRTRRHDKIPSSQRRILQNSLDGQESCMGQST